MKIADLERGVSENRSLVIDVRNTPDFPGYVRTITLRDSNRVTVEFEPFGLDEGGAYYRGQYAKIYDAVVALEKYLDMPISEWPALSKVWRYPLKRPETNPAEGHKRLQLAITENRMPLPGGTKFELLSSHWKQFESEDR